MNKLPAIFTILLAALSASAAEPLRLENDKLAGAQADFYVSTNGNDGWSGRLPEANDTRAIKRDRSNY